MISLTRSRGEKGWTIYLVLRLPIWFRRFERQTIKVQPQEPEAQTK